MFKRLTPQEVFTPRAARVNGEMYIHRPHLEKQLRSAIRGHKHFIVFGESGNGKTWLYKKVFEDTKTVSTVVNLATAANFKSIFRALQDKWAILEPNRVSSQSTETGGALKVGVEMGSKRTTAYNSEQSNPFMGIIKHLSRVSGQKAIIVFDNFERIANKPDLIEELANYLIFLDDDDYAQFDVRICIVGVPGDLKDYFAKLPFAETISTRLSEIEEVRRMTYDEAKELLARGFSMLRLRAKESESLDIHIDRIIHVSDRTAVELHAIGLKVAERARNNEGIIEGLDVSEAIKEWITEKYSKICADVEARMSPAGIMNGRRNQLLFCLGLIDTVEFDKGLLIDVIKREFPKKSAWVNSDFDSIFEPFLEGFEPMVRRGTQSGSFRISKAAYRMAIRALLKTDSQKVLYKVNRKI